MNNAKRITSSGNNLPVKILILFKKTAPYPNRWSEYQNSIPKFLKFCI